MSCVCGVSLTNVSDAWLTDERFERDPAFDLRAYARRSFGTFQERPVKVVLRFLRRVARDAAAFLFHPDQAVEENSDGSVTVRFTAGGIDEMCWHLVTWATASSSRNPPDFESGWPRCANLSLSITIQPTRSDAKPWIVSDCDRIPGRSTERSD